MLFEPCGDLRKDYGAYCETLRLTEREEVYRALRTKAGSGGEESPTHPPDTAADASAPASAALPNGAAATGVKAGKASRKASAAATRRGGGKGKDSDAVSGEGGQGSADVATTAAVAAANDAELQGRPTLTYITMRHPTFCLNQRDITPLCRAMPHCPSLMSVQLTGCGLSEQAYMLLVEAVYKCRRVMAVEVDFNAIPHTGFVPDPTAQASTTTPNRSRGSTPQPLPEEGGHAASTTAADVTEKVTDQQVAADAAEPRQAEATESGEAAGQRRTSRKASVRSKRSTSVASRRVSKRASDAVAAAAAAEAAAAALVATDEPGAIYLKPTEFRGLHTLPTPLEEQVAEERDKKGKVDPKKVAQLQAQLEAMHEFDRAHRIKVPRGWHGMLYTGLSHLSLRGNGIHDEAVAQMVEAVLGNPYTQLTTLSLWGNAITDAGAVELARLLASNQTLRVLDVGRNQLGDEGALALVDCFRVREVGSPEELTHYRQAVLTRPSATEEERQAAAMDTTALVASLQPASQPTQPLPPHLQQMFTQPPPGGIIASAVYPSYQDMYRVWHATRALPVGATAHHGGAGSGVPGTHETSTVDATTQSNASSVSGSGRRGGGGGGGGKGKSAKNEPPPLPTALLRPKTPFDRHCVRVASSTDSAVRVPGNTVLEVLNLGENAYVTVRGAREAARRLALHEPQTDAEMAALAVSEPTSSAAPQYPPPLNVQVAVPEAYCAGLRLRSLVFFAKRYADGEAAWADMVAAQRSINAALDSWAPSPPSPSHPPQGAAGTGATEGQTGHPSDGAAAATAAGGKEDGSRRSTPQDKRTPSRSPKRSGKAAKA